MFAARWKATMLVLNRNESFQPDFFSNIHTYNLSMRQAHDSNLRTDQRRVPLRLRSSSALQFQAKSPGDGKLASPIIDRVQLNYLPTTEWIQLANEVSQPGCLGQ
ncbi:hypothetical protein FVEG_02848 [Fusarium verticillioides 7600]|uniref:Uncharacterized protein n=1 Tax=Gibberella moniliformis (strain M3125 / FGSC 7600) TaxID=334819 RepID=W7LM50_GIBM7|nr:hypothetical protein FVEG_02848 [Fusarium verticillioides 7600]EWG40468.1 hypothetical protein FVEG_02848 [Fusarium verticillioides 7600]